MEEKKSVISYAFHFCFLVFLYVPMSIRLRRPIQRGASKGFLASIKIYFFIDLQPKSM